ncbi:unnamed protein product [Thlaspi arvense]|uniref:Retrotransposon gag domain-containing protein n=1 Tax=Thlaspi arvense TaxID=13288 RepID=A0AAU9SBZ5_THLAR|nr:unnamed protein product [Thlaspi arvense]
MSNLLDTIGQTSRETTQPPQDSSTKPIEMINYFSDTSANSCDDNSDKESLPKQFAIGEGSTAPKRKPNINEVFLSDEEMSYTRPQNQEPPPKQFTSKVMIFTFNDIPFEKWNDRLDEFHAWMTSEAITSPLELVIQLFMTRLSGALKEWWNSLGEYRQQQVYQTTIPLLLGEIHREFIGTPTHLKEQLQEEFFSAKCCSLKKKDLAKHFERQTRRYYALNGLNNPSLKQVYLSSIDDYLSQQTMLYIRDQRQTIKEIFIGQIQQYVFRTLDKLCKQKEFWMEFMDKSKQLSKICARPDLSIKYSEDEVQPPYLPVTIFDPRRKKEPVHAIAFIDTGTHSSIMNLKVLLSSMWLPHQQEFQVANAGSLSVKLKSKAITIEIFPGCQVTTEVLGSSAPGKDLIMGWDTYYALKKKFDISLELRNEMEVFLQSLHKNTSHIFT